MRAERWVLAGAMILPTAFAAVYFVILSSAGVAEQKPNLLLQIAYVGSKVIQFLIPIAWVAIVDRASLRPGRLSLRGVPTGLAFGIAVAALILALYYGHLSTSPTFDGAADRIRTKVSEFGMATPGRFIALAGFLSVVHSFLEEYYWRWFVYGRLRRHVPRGAALALSGLAFTAHHAIILWVYFPGHVWTAVLPFSLGIAVGGIAWAWLYERTGSLIGPWLSHLIVDAALMAVGYELMFGTV